MIVSILTLSSCENFLFFPPVSEDKIFVNDDGYLVVNGVKTEYKVNGGNVSDEKIFVNDDGYLVVNGVKTEYKVNGGNVSDENTCTHTQREENRIESTCEKAGSYDLVIYCTECGIEFSKTSVVIEKLTHIESDWIIDSYSTCTAEGSRHKECTSCGELLEREIIPATDKHNYGTDGKCTVCGAENPDCTPGYSIGLEYTLSDDGTRYIVSGIGTCTDANIIIPDTYNSKPVTEIFHHAFDGHHVLNQTFFIPYSITKIHTGAAAFHPFLRATHIEVDESNPTYKSVDGNLYTKDGKTLVAYVVEKTDVTYTIPKGVEVIGFGALFSISNLENLVLPSTIIKIQQEAINSYALDCIYYGGTKTQWSNIYMESIYSTTFFSKLTSIPRYYYSETHPTEEGNFWHYVDGAPTVWQ